MSARFRIRTSQGQELSFATYEMFVEFVRSGDLSPDDVVYDAETREWAPARTHPVVLQLETEAEDETPDGGEPPAEAARDDDLLPEARARAGSDFGLELAPAADQPSQEEAAAAFVKKMEAERASESAFDDEAAIEGFKMDVGSSGLVEGIAEPPSAAPPPPPVAPVRPPPRRAPPPVSRGRDRTPGPPPEKPKRAKPKKERPKKEKRKKKATKKGRGAAARYAPFLILGAVVAGVAAYFAPELLAPPAGAGNEAGPDTVTVPPVPPPLIRNTEEALRERAEERFLRTTQAELRRLEPIPETWLSGAYLSLPSDFPEVREAWEEYLTTIRAVRAGDDERYRAGYLTALDDARVEGPDAAARLATAVAEFRAEAGARAAHYDRVEALASAAIQSHDALLGAEGMIAHEPATVSGGPAVEAVGRGPEAQAFLDEVLELIAEHLEADGGPGEPVNVREWVWDGLLDAVTN